MILIIQSPTDAIGKGPSIYYVINRGREGGHAKVFPLMTFTLAIN
jgi:hypothetical protein